MEIEIRGDEELFKKLDKLTKVGSTKAMKGMGGHLSALMKRYPPQPSGSTYRRTGNLGRRWDVKAKPRAATVFNPTKYSPYVQDDRAQTWFHKRTGWSTLKRTAEDNMDAIVRILKRQVDKILRS
jgi:hypothetical protein